MSELRLFDGTCPKCGAELKELAYHQDEEEGEWLYCSCERCDWYDRQRCLDAEPGELPVYDYSRRCGKCGGELGALMRCWYDQRGCELRERSCSVCGAWTRERCLDAEPEAEPDAPTVEEVKRALGQALRQGHPEHDHCAHWWNTPKVYWDLLVGAVGRLPDNPPADLTRDALLAAARAKAADIGHYLWESEQDGALWYAAVAYDEAHPDA